MIISKISLRNGHAIDRSPRTIECAQSPGAARIPSRHRQVKAMCVRRPVNAVVRQGLHRQPEIPERQIQVVRNTRNRKIVSMVPLHIVGLGGQERNRTIFERQCNRPPQVILVAFDRPSRIPIFDVDEDEDTFSVNYYDLAMRFPKHLYYSEQDTWIRVGEFSGVVTVGLTDYSRIIIGDNFSFEINVDLNAIVSPTKEIGLVKSNKTELRLFPPVSEQRAIYR